MTMSQLNGVAIRQDGAPGPWLVLSNGIGTDMRLWDGVVERLASHLRILRHHWSGHGASPNHNEELSLRGQAADLIPEHVRANAPIVPPPPPKRGGRPPKHHNGGADH